MDRVTALLPERLQPAAKVVVPALLVVAIYVVNGLASGDWTLDDRVEEALLVLISLATVYAVPNSG